VHLPETGDADRPHLLTDVATTTAPVSDFVATGAIQDRLAGAVRSRPLAAALLSARFVSSPRTAPGASTARPVWVGIGVAR
jgi:hypothetical protein